MKFLDQIEEAAKLAGYETRRENFRSLQVIQILENGIWVTFDPINRGKDVAKLVYAMAKKEGFKQSELDFRLEFILGAIHYMKEQG